MSTIKCEYCDKPVEKEKAQKYLDDLICQDCFKDLTGDED